MRKDKSPAYQWYPRDYTSDALVVSMTLEQEGAYRRLLDVEWLEGALPNDPAQLWRLAKAPSRAHFERHIWPVIHRKFVARKRFPQACGKVISGGLLINKRLEREREKQTNANRLKQLAAEWRWHKEQCKCSTDASCEQCFAFAIAIASTKSKKHRPAKRAPAVENSKPKNQHLGVHEATFGLYCVIAREALGNSRRLDHDETVVNVAEHFKTLCAQRKLDYDAMIASSAIEACTPSGARPCVTNGPPSR